MPVPNTFATATGTISLALLDSNFSTAITIGNTAVQLGNTVTTLNNMTLANVNVTSGTVTANYLPTVTFLKNRIINGAMAIDQRNAGASQTFTAGAALAYAVDRWYGYCTGANVTGQRVAGSNQDQYRYQFTGAASVTAIGFAQRIEQLNSYDLNNTTATLSVDLANSLLTTVTWTAYYANTANTFGTLASPTRTQIATGTFTVTNIVTRYTTSISVPAAATTGIEIVFTVGAQTSGTWTIGNVQLEPGSSATVFERRQYGQELELCKRYYAVISSLGLLRCVAGGAYQGGQTSTAISPTMRTTPTAALTLLAGNYNDPVISPATSSATLYFNSGTNVGDYAVYEVRLTAEL